MKSAILLLLLVACAGPTGDVRGGASVGRLDVSVASGAVRLVAGEALGLRYAVRAPLGGGAVALIEEPDGTRVVASCADLRPCTVDLVLTVPAGLPVGVEQGAGSLEIDGLDRVQAHLGRGTVRALVGEALDLSVGVGSVEVKALGRGPVRVAVGQGDVALQVPAGAYALDLVGASVVVTGIEARPGALRQIQVVAPGGAVLLSAAGPVAAR